MADLGHPAIGHGGRDGRKADFEAVRGAWEPVLGAREGVGAVTYDQRDSPGDHILEGVDFRRER
jgi:hypothetical protein